MYQIPNGYKLDMSDFEICVVPLVLCQVLLQFIEAYNNLEDIGYVGWNSIIIILKYLYKSWKSSTSPFYKKCPTWQVKTEKQSLLNWELFLDLKFI
ncbi:hypothetical protein NQ315_009342, partial [Exocentrus adspersus]